MSMSHDEMIAVIQAHKDGKTLQFRATPDGINMAKLLNRFVPEDEVMPICGPQRYSETELEGWSDMNREPRFNFQFAEYRTKP